MDSIDLIIFDLDGTLIDSLADLADATNHMLTSLGRKAASLDHVRGFVGQGVRRLVEKAMPDAGAEEIEIGLSVFLAYNEEHIVDKTRLYPGAEETLSALRGSGKTLAVVSNKNVALCRKALTTLKADGFFQCVIGADSLRERKPSPEPLRKVMADLGFTPGRTAIVGDSINDIAAGKAAGILTIGCSFGYGDRNEIAGADYIIDTPSALLRLPMFACS